jgi:hypothetical protein
MSQIVLNGNFDLISTVNGNAPALGHVQETVNFHRDSMSGPGNNWNWVILIPRGGSDEAFGYADGVAPPVAKWSWIVPTSNAEEPAILDYLRFACAADMRKTDAASARKNLQDVNPYIRIVALWRLADLKMASGAELFDSLQELGEWHESEPYFVDLLMTYYNGDRSDRFVADLKPYLKNARPENQQLLLVNLCQWVSAFPVEEQRFYDPDLIVELTSLATQRVEDPTWKATCALYDKLNKLLSSPAATQSSAGSPSARR